MTAVTIIGNLASEIELRFTSGGRAVANFTVAENNRVKKDGEWVDGDPTFWRCQLWADAAENLTESLTKGVRVIAHGDIKQRTFESNGEKRTVTEVTVQEIGPSLRWATAKVERRGNRNGPAPTPKAAADDPWGTGGSDDTAPPF